MIKVCSLDFLNRDVFDTDVMGKNGSIIYAAGDPVTPEIILNLYFKEIYVDEKFFEEEERKVEEAEMLKRQQKEEIDRLKQLENDIEKLSKEETKEREKGVRAPEIVDSEEETEIEIEEKGPREYENPFAKTASDSPKKPYGAYASAGVSSTSKMSEGKLAEENAEPKAPIIEKLEFDEAKAKRISEYATLLGKSIGMSAESLKDLEKAAYHCHIGRKMFTVEDLKTPGFKMKQAAASYNILVNEMDFPEKIAEVAKDYLEKYDTREFPIDKEFQSNIPFAHIVAIADYYDDLLSNNTSKEDALKKMLQLGGNRFNIYVLHKFVSLMRR